MFDRRNRARLASRAVHDGGVQLNFARAVQHGAMTGVEQRGVFHHPDGGANRFEAGAMGIEQVVPRLEGSLQGSSVFGF